MVTFGILMAYVFSYGTCPLSGSAPWRVVVGLALALALTLGIGLWTPPESPRWLVHRKRFDEAKRVLSRMRGAKTVVEHDYLDIASKAGVEEQTKSSFWQSWTECFIGTPGTYKLVYRTFVGVMLQSFRQLTGPNYFFYYGATIFVSVSIQDSFVTQIILGAVNFFCIFFGLYVIEKFGRRNPLVFGGFWQGAWLIVFATAGTAKNPTPTDEMPNGRPQVGYLMIVSACLFIASFASTYGPGSWIITGETFPISHRARQASIAAASNWVWKFSHQFFFSFHCR
ncbi:general substrate transporter [Wallemia mellicola]|nr:general substrate transporter [Wallemia mellicola]